MDVIRYPADPPPKQWRAPVLALGNFDGLHRGHVKIIDRVHRSAVERGATAVALTFDPHPTQVTRPDKAPPLLMTAGQKLEAFELAGMHGAAVVSFTPEFSRWDPDLFVRRVLVDWLRISEVWVGANFLFGHDRAGNFSVLRQLGSRYGFRAEKIDPVRYKDFVVSSTRIRRLVSEGRVDEAAALLGRHYFIDGEVVRGDGRGQQIGFPTANLVTANRVIPPHGVYASIVRLDRACWPSVTNVGTRPTFGAGAAPSIETHLLDGSRDLYGETLRLFFVQRLRDERPFESAQALAAQIAEDCRLVRALFEQVSV
ncbi:MAG: bifunctional riboflavin kinase/FAD synthetase [Acidobacteriota bacterium]